MTSKTKNILGFVFVGLVVLAAVIWTLTHPEAGTEVSWSIGADVAESCSCTPPCPCVFGGKHNNDVCEGSRLIEIERGQFNDVRLDGIPVVVTFRMGEWARYYISDRATDEQFEAAAELISHAFPSFAEWGILATERVPVSVERTDDLLSFTVPDASVAMKPMAGLDGTPVKVQNLPAAFLADYTQYVSERSTHTGEEHGFEYSGTNGFTSRLDATN